VYSLNTQSVFLADDLPEIFIADFTTCTVESERVEAVVFSEMCSFFMCSESEPFEGEVHLNNI
jgi:hypothetical protein